jgi:hypothetical protein
METGDGLPHGFWLGVHQILRMIDFSVTKAKKFAPTDSHGHSKIGSSDESDLVCFAHL